MKSRKGLSLVEMMLGIGILTIVLSALMYMVNFAYSEKARVVSRTVQEKILQSVSADLRADSSIYQKNFAASTVDNTTILTDNNLPYRWTDASSNLLYKNNQPQAQPAPNQAEQAQSFCDATAKPVAGTMRGRDACCPGCPGKMGYTIRPVNGWPGMYMATVRLSNKSLTGGEAWYEFIVVPK